MGKTNVGNSPAGVAVSGTDVWVADDVDNTVSRISTRGAPTVTRAISVGPGARGIAVGEGAVWVAQSQTDQVARIDPQTEAVTDTIEVGGRPTGIAAGDGAVWVANSVSGTLSRIDPDSRDVDLTVELGQSPQDVAIADGRVWATLNEKVTPPPASGDDDGGTMRVLLGDDPNLEPASASTSDPARGYLTCAGLYSYADAPSPAGSTLEPEVAAGPPEISDGGRTYRFHIRPGYAFSPPSDEPVTAASFEREIQRVLSPEIGAFASHTIQDIVGAKAYARDPNGGLAGVSADGDELVIRLTRPVPDFLARISGPAFCAVPADTPTVLRGSSVIPSAGPYYVAEYVPGQRVVLRRNPNYGGSRAAELAEIDYEIGFPAEEAIGEVEDGDADLYSDPLGSAIAPDDVRRLDRLYGTQSEEAAAGRQRLFIGPQLTIHYLLIDSSRPPFDDPRVRRAINHAVDRRALAREPFPGTTGRPTDQILPPGLPGFADAAIYPLGGPDLERARELAGPLDADAVLLTCDLPPCLELGETVRANLAPLGIDVEVRLFPIPEMFERINSGEPLDLALYNWLADYPDPVNFVNGQFEGGPIRQRVDGAFAGNDLDRRMSEAAAVSGDARYEAYADLDHDLMAEAAPIVPYASGTNVSFFSERIGCQVEHPIYGIDLGRLCIR